MEIRLSLSLGTTGFSVSFLKERLSDSFFQVLLPKRGVRISVSFSEISLFMGECLWQARVRCPCGRAEKGGRTQFQLAEQISSSSVIF